MSLIAHPQRWNHPSLFRLGIPVAMLLVSAACHRFYPGDLAAYALFSVASAALAASALQGRRSVFALVVAIFLSLGFWVKLMLHLLAETGFNEPIGSFDGSGPAWDRALIASAAGLAGTAAAITACKLLDGGRPAHADTAVGSNTLLSRYAWPLFALSCMAALFLLLFNFHFSVLKVGTVPRLALPSHLYIIVAFVVSWGAMLWLGALGFWLVSSGRASPALLLHIGAVEGAAAAISMGSRAQMILHAGSMLVLFLLYARSLNWHLPRRSVFTAVAVMAILFPISLATVSLDRAISFAKAIPAKATPAQSYAAEPVEDVRGPAAPAAQTLARTDPAQPDTAFPPAGSPAPGAAETVEEVQGPMAPTGSKAVHVQQQSPPPLTIRLQHSLQEIARLFTGRWLGLDGVLAVTSTEKELGIPLLVDGLYEDPARGVDAIYQKMAASTYQRYSNFVFMTIPGPVALLMFSGSLGIVALGMAIFCAIGYAVERFADLTTRNPAVSSTAGVGLAYFLVQMNFPYNQLIFVIELLCAIAAIGVFRLVLKLLSSRPHAMPNLPRDTGTPAR